MASLIPQTKQTILKITEFDSKHLQDIPFRNHFDLCSFNLIKKQTR